jgi:hypothetical protein
VHQSTLEDAEQSVRLKGLTHRPIADDATFARLLHIANAHRAVGSTRANDRSSRSYAVAIVTLSEAVTELASATAWKARNTTLSRPRRLAKLAQIWRQRARKLSCCLVTHKITTKNLSVSAKPISTRKLSEKGNRPGPFLFFLRSPV